MKYIKNATRLFNKDYVNKRGLDLSKEVLWVSGGQSAPELRAVKVGGKKSSATRPREGKRCLKRAVQQNSFFLPPTLRACSFAIL